MVERVAEAGGRRRRRGAVMAGGRPATHKSSLSGSFQPITRDAQANLIAARHQLPRDHRGFLFTARFRTVSSRLFAYLLNTSNLLLDPDGSISIVRLWLHIVHF